MMIITRHPLTWKDEPRLCLLFVKEGFLLNGRGRIVNRKRKPAGFRAKTTKTRRRRPVRKLAPQKSFYRIAGLDMIYMSILIIM